MCNMWLIEKFTNVLRKYDTLSALIFEGLNFRATKISHDLIHEIWLNSRKFAKYKSRKISQKLQTAKIAKLNYHETMKLPIKGISN